MSREFNPASVEQAIYDCAQRIENGVTKCHAAFSEFQRLDREFDVAEAKAYLRHSESPAHERKYHAVLDTQEERAKRDVAEATHKLCDRQMRALMAELDALRSIGTSVRQAYATANRGDFA